MIRVFLFVVVMALTTNAHSAECGLFRVVKGKVTYKQKGKKKFRKARINKKVCQGDTVKTEAASRTKIVMADKNELNISPKSQVLIEVYQNAKNGSGKVLLDVVYGKVRSNVKQKYKDNKRSHYRVKTKSAVAGVRGTEFMASFNQATSESRVVTFEGEVMVGQMRGGQFMPQVSVKPGQFTSNSPGSNPHPAKEVPPQEFAKIDQESNVGDGARDVSSGTTTEPAAVEPESGDSDKPTSEPKNEGQPEAKKPDSPAAGNQSPKTDGPKDQAGRPNAGPGSKPPVGGPAASPDAPKNEGGDFGGIFDNDNSAGGDTGNAGDPLSDVAGDFDDMNSPGGDNNGRSPASIDAGGDMGLPPPTLDDMPMGDDYGNVMEPPRLPTMDPILDMGPECLTCNDAVINQNEKVNLTIIPVLEN